MPNDRRTFLIRAAGATSALAAARFASAQGGAPLSESDPQAQALGYKADATKVDKTKYPKYAAGQTCSTCQLYQGKSADATGPCPIFSGKLVASKGWCSAWVKKA
ncbi:MAG: high-potential iron-sulfur protein [bacterium]